VVTGYDLAAQICEALGLDDPNVVRKITLTPREATVEVFVRNADGEKFVDPTTDMPAIEKRTFRLAP
jgi:pyrroloquinoline quinone (PQQ) biosynthesis protein C